MYLMTQVPSGVQQGMVTLSFGCNLILALTYICLSVDVIEPRALVNMKYPIINF